MKQLDRMENMLMFDYAMTLFIIAQLNDGFIGLLFGFISTVCLLIGLWDTIKGLKQTLRGEGR